MTPEAERVLATLRRHPAGLTMDVLARWTSLGRRDVEAAVQELRLAGEPVITGSFGVRLSDDPAEVAAAAEGLRRRLVTQYLGVRALRQTAKAMHMAADAEQDLTLWR